MDRNRMHRYGVRATAAIFVAALSATWGTPQPAYAQDAPKKVVLRFAADFPPPPHPAGIAMKYFGDRLPQVIPGSEARLYYAGAWPPSPQKHGTPPYQLLHQENKILMPAAFSPLQ